MTIYFTSDLHLGHTDILAFAQRPWKTIEEHDAAIIGNINSTVGKNDRLYILGDFTMRFHTADASIMLHGHIHSCALATNGDNAREGIWRYDVGVDANFYRPVSYEQISDFISARDPNFPAEK